MTRQGVRVLRPTRPAGPIVDLAELIQASPTRDDDLNFALAHFAGSLDDSLRIPAWQASCLPQSAGRTETNVVVPVRRLIVVTVGGTDVRRLIVERPATQQTATQSPPSGRLF